MELFTKWRQMVSPVCDCRSSESWLKKLAMLYSSWAFKSFERSKNPLHKADMSNMTWWPELSHPGYFYGPRSNWGNQSKCRTEGPIFRYYTTYWDLSHTQMQAFHRVFLPDPQGFSNLQLATIRGNKNWFGLKLCVVSSLGACLTLAEAPGHVTTTFSYG